MQKYFLFFLFKLMPTNVYYCIIDRMTLILSSNFTLMAMYRSFSMQFKWNNWTEI